MLLDPSKIKVFTTSVVAEIGLATIWNYYFFHFVSGIWDIGNKKVGIHFHSLSLVGP